MPARRGPALSTPPRAARDALARAGDRRRQHQVGGTGKTPLVIALVEALRARGTQARRRQPRLRRRSWIPRHCSMRLASPRDVGDEPMLIRAQPALPVAVGRDRAAAASPAARVTTAT